MGRDFSHSARRSPLGRLLVAILIGLVAFARSESSEQLSVVSSGIEIHTIALSGFPQSSPPPGIGADGAESPASGVTLPASLKDHTLSRSPPPRSVSSEETLTGFIRVAVATVTFNKPVWVHRAPQAAPSPDGSFPAPRSASGPASRESRPALDAEDAAEAFFSGSAAAGDAALSEGGSYGVVATPRTAALAANVTGDLYGTLGLARMTCGRLVFDSYPAPTASHAPPRFLVPSEHISLYLSELPAVVAALPQLMSCENSGATRSRSPGPGSNQLSYLLILAHSRSGLPAIEYHPPAALANCRLSFPPAQGQGWRPAGHLSASCMLPRAAAKAADDAAAAAKAADAAAKDGSASAAAAAAKAAAEAATAAAAEAAAARAFTGSVPLPLVETQTRTRALADLGVVGAQGAQAAQMALRPVPGPLALSRARASLSLCWPGLSAGFQGFRAPARARLLPSDALVRRALRASAEDLLGGEGRELLALAQGQGQGQDAATPATEEMVMMEMEARTHKRSSPSSFSAVGSAASAAASAPAPAGAAGDSAGEWSARGFAASAAAAAAATHTPHTPLSAEAAAAAEVAATSAGGLSHSAALDGLASSLVVHAEPWVVSLLETGSELSTDAAAASMGAASNMMMGLLSNAFSPAIKPLVPTVSTSIGQDVTGVLLEPLQKHTTTGISQGIIDLLEPMLTGEISAALVPTLIETITDEVIEGTALAVADQVAIDATPILTASITDRVSKAIVPIVAQNITVHTAADIVRNCTRPLAALLPRAISHAIVPALSQTLTLSPDEHEKCYKCAVLEDPMACMVCPDDKKSKEQWGMAPSLYYAIYYTGYYSTYYSAYYGDIFAKNLSLRGVRRREIDPNDPVPDPIGFEGDGPGQI